MTPQQKIMQKLIHMVTGKLIEDGIEDKYEALDDGESSDDLYDAKAELRSGEEHTDLPCGYSRHYEARAVAAQMLDGSWVGWTYWYGGGKHGEPGSIEWIDDAYDVEMKEVMQPVKVFSIRAEPS